MAVSEHPSTAMQRSHDMPVLYFCSQSVNILHFKVPSQVRVQITRQATTKTFLEKLLMDNWERKSAHMNQ